MSESDLPGQIAFMAGFFRSLYPSCQHHFHDFVI